MLWRIESFLCLGLNGLGDIAEAHVIALEKAFGWKKKTQEQKGYQILVKENGEWKEKMLTANCSMVIDIITELINLREHEILIKRKK
ncbi:hypothetical protein [Thermoflavimicrobium daqui]|jgi:hypothetical protein|uniref:Uncharacterized protein n=1 Tax=Thermoflavimicrobium daqui TaxID=2137476 RepID=A0A364K6M9_9BACL|nr:hypothetical protein [Thermoflavimicrobium daqui]RAL25938.1 hypothetical protein DL897_07660 [Thermoflavimicrobium daqui]